MGGPDLADTSRRDRRDRVTGFAADLGHALLLKGADDIVADGNDVRINRTGNPGMTVGGTGDVLAGAAGALLATQSPLAAGALAAYANGLAGDRIVDSRGYGLLASDLLPELPRALWGDRRE
jgi:NAD(P)H-hydrate epimerase